VSRLPTSCSHCHRPFSGEPNTANLALIDAGVALCDQCVWLVEHPESADVARTERDRAA